MALLNTQNIKEKENGHFLFTVSNGIDTRTGKQIRKKHTWKPPATMTKAQARKQAPFEYAKFVEEFKNGELIFKDLTFAEYSEKWLKYKKSSCKVSTFDDYTNKLKNINKHLGHIKLSQLKRIHLNDLYLKAVNEPLFSNKPLSPTSVEDYNRVISSMLSSAIKDGIIKENIAQYAELPKKQPKQKYILTETEYTNTLNNIDTFPIKYSVVFLMALTTGMRLSEILGITTECINFNSKTLTINKQLQYNRQSKEYFYTSTKTATSNRIILLPDITIEYLRKYEEWKKAQAELLQDLYIPSTTDGRYNYFTNDYGKQIHHTTFNKEWHKFCKRNNITLCRFHDLRHTFVSYAFNARIQPALLQKYVGHANLSTTINIYTHSINNNFISIANNIDNMANNALTNDLNLIENGND